MALEACNFQHIFTGNEEKLGILFNHQSYQLREGHPVWGTHWLAGRAAHLKEAKVHGSSVPPASLSCTALPVGSSHVIFYNCWLQTWNKRLRSLFNTVKWILNDLPASISPYLIQGAYLAGITSPLPLTLQPRRLSCSSIYNLTILVTCSLYHWASLLHPIFSPLSLPSLPTPHIEQLSLVMSTLDSPTYPCLCLLSHNYNKPSLPLYLGAAVSFPFHLWHSITNWQM